VWRVKSKFYRSKITGVVIPKCVENLCLNFCEGDLFSLHI
jgi:hypothetical protein